MDGTTNSAHTWIVVLGGSPRAGRPEQPGESPPRLGHALDLALLLSDASRVVMVLSPDDLRDGPVVHPALAEARVIVEPADRGSATALYLALCHIQAIDPDAQVVSLPADHFLHPALTFVARLDAALEIARRIDRIVLLGVAPTSADTRQGWILPGSPLARVNHLEVRRVETFIDRPGRDLAVLIQETGGLWSTTILAAPLGRLWASGRRRVPDLTSAFAESLQTTGAPPAQPVLEDVYARLPVRAISTHLLHSLGEDLTVAELDGVTWCDWECTGQILDMLQPAGSLPLNVRAS